MPAVVVLRRQAGNRDGAALEVSCQSIMLEQFLEREAVAFDPVSGGEVDGGEDREPAVGGRGNDQRVVWVGDGSCSGFDLAGEELVEGCVFVWVRFYQLAQAVAQVEGIDESLDVSFALFRIVRDAHMPGLIREYFLHSFPFQRRLVARTVVQEVHAQAHSDGHALEGLLAGVPIDDIVPEMPRFFKVFKGWSGDAIANKGGDGAVCCCLVWWSVFTGLGV